MATPETPAPETPAPLAPVSGYRAFPDAGAMSAALAARLAETLDQALKADGRASLAVSGGSTPKPTYEALSDADLDWARVTVVLVDERWVDSDQEGSNAAFVRACLLRGQAAAARFISLKTDHARPADAVEAINARLSAAPWPFAAIVLGLGADGHTASWFPEAEGLAAALDPEPRLKAAAVRAKPSVVTGAFLDRMTLTRGALTGARLTALAIRGNDKRAAYDLVRAAGPISAAPARALWAPPALGVETFWAP